MTPKGAFISLKQIASSFLLRKGKTVHGMWKAYAYGAEAIREILLSSPLPLIQNKLLIRPEGQGWWDLPDDFEAICAVGVHYGSVYQQIAISQNLMPFMQPNGLTWGAANAVNAPFSPGSFSTGFNTLGTAATPAANYCGRLDEVVLDEIEGKIMAHGEWTKTELYIQYVGTGGADMLTQITIKAQAAIEAYIAWKWAEAKRNNGTESERLESKWRQQWALLRARLTPWNIETLRRSVFFGPADSYEVKEGLFYTSASRTELIFVVGQLVYLPTAGDAFITSAKLIGKTVTLISGSGWSKPQGDGYNQPDGTGTIVFTDGTTLAAQNITIFFY